MRVERIGDAVLYLGDCLEILPTLPKVDAVITDPPFGIGFKYTPGFVDEFVDYGAWIWQRIELAERLCVEGSPIFVWQSAKWIRDLPTMFPRNWRLFVSAKNFVQMRSTEMQWSFDPVVVWWKHGFSGVTRTAPTKESMWSAETATRDFYVSNTAPVIANPANIEKGHPCPRPLDVTQHVIGQWVRPETTCLDPFMGSGTTGVACANLGRKFIGIEIEPKYFDIACERIDNAYRQARMFA